jgi:hypothetical protein
LPEGKPTDSGPCLVEVRVFDEARDNRGLATLHPKMAKVAAAEVDHSGSEIGGGIVQRSSRSGNPNKGLLHQFLGVCWGADKQQRNPNHPVPLRTVQSF